MSNNGFNHPSMNVDEAWAIIDEVCGAYVGTRAQHVKIQIAQGVIKGILDSNRAKEAKSVSKNTQN